MIGFFSLFKDRQNRVKKEEIYFVSIPDNLNSEDIKKRFAKIAKLFAAKLDTHTVYLNYGEKDFIEYDYKI